MHVIGHDYPSAQFIKSSLPLASLDRIHRQAGDPWILEPHWTGGIAIHGAIGGYEGMSWRRVWVGQRMSRERSPETPGQEQVGIIGVEMRQSPSVFEHRTRVGRRNRL